MAELTNCKIHHHECCVGICASCLRERLLAVIAARESGRTSDSRRDQHLPPISPAAPPPLFFPPSVSSYSGNRQSAGSGPFPARFHGQQRLFSTPQVGPLIDWDENISGIKKKFSILTSLFGSRNRSTSKTPRSNCSIFGLFPGRRKRDGSQFSPEKSKSFPVDRGMSPQEEDDNNSVCSSGSESSTVYRRPEPTPVRKFPSASPSRNLGVSISGFAMCLSPLIRPTPKPAADIDPRGGSCSLGRKWREQHVSAGEASLGPCRSRKLADFGRCK